MNSWFWFYCNWFHPSRYLSIRYPFDTIVRVCYSYDDSVNRMLSTRTSAMGGSSARRHERWFLTEGNVIFLVCTWLISIDNWLLLTFFQVGGKLFRLHDAFLRTTSSLFDTMFDLPQPQPHSLLHEGSNYGILTPPSSQNLISRTANGLNDENPIEIPSGPSESSISSNDFEHLMEYLYKRWDTYK